MTHQRGLTESHKMDASNKSKAEVSERTSGADPGRQCSSGSNGHASTGLLGPLPCSEASSNAQCSDERKGQSGETHRERESPSGVVGNWSRGWENPLAAQQANASSLA